MPHIVVTYRYVPGPEAEAQRDALRPSHREHLAAIDGLLLSGPTTGPDGPGATIVLEAPSTEVVEGWLDDDPFVTAGLVAERSVVTWTLVLGRARDRLA